MGIVPKAVKRLAMSTREAGSYLTGCLEVSVVGCLSFDLLLAIVALQEFTSKEIRNSIFRTFNIFNIKIKTLKIACHRAKICFEAIFSTSFSITYLALLQSIRNKNF